MRFGRARLTDFGHAVDRGQGRINLTVRDPTRSAAWYAQLLGMQRRYAHRDVPTPPEAIASQRSGDQTVGVATNTVPERLTAICLALPEAVSDEGHPPHRSFRIGKKNFAWYVENEHDDGRIAVIVRVPPGENAELVAADAERFALPKYVARHGWVSYFLDLAHRPVDWDEVTELVTDSYRIQAPKRLARLLD